MNKEPIYLDQEGYNEFLASIEEIQEKMRINDLGRKEAFDAGAGDGWDSPEFEEIERTSIMLSGELQRKYEDLKRIVIVEKQNNKDIIDIGDVVLVGIEYSKNDIEDMTFKLVGTSGDPFADTPEISINSPLGSAVYKKKIGGTCSYSVKGNTMSVVIKEKIDSLNEENTPMKR